MNGITFGFKYIYFVVYKAKLSAVEMVKYVIVVNRIYNTLLI